MDLAYRFQNVHFVSTFASGRKPSNMSTTGVIRHEQMKKLIQSATVYLATTKETFGIGILEAMASGVPVLGYNYGGIKDLVQHGVNGYLANPGDIDDLSDGLDYCGLNHDILGANGRELAKQYTWENMCEKVAGVYEKALHEKPAGVTVVIPSWNYADKVGRAIESIQKQSFKNWELFIVDDGSDDDGATERVVRELDDSRVKYIRQGNQGVASARNRGIGAGTKKYVCCLDADDAIGTRFLDVCVNALENDRSLGIAYTGLWYIKPDGAEGVSPWPGKWDFDTQLKKRNQVPTCCVFRRDMWEALGGYRGRYCPHGAGSEDAEFWTRCGAYGWKAEKVTEEPLFIYSWQSGRVSGDPKYQEMDWLDWHPWARDGQHPLASYAKPKRWSHPVRQYDEPAISVIIPVGPGHDLDVLSALDSLDAQTFRHWECIVVWDGQKSSEVIERTFPHVKYLYNEKAMGAGAARNQGAAIARAPFLLFLDADDWLYPECIEKMFRMWDENEGCIYTDYVGKSIITQEYAERLMKDKRLLFYDADTGEAVVSYITKEYEWERAQRQPEGNTPWIWNNVTTLLPKVWFEEIDGFDEQMPSWEDVDLWYRLSKAGKPFFRIPEQLMVYQLHAGNRRQDGYESAGELLKYLKEKYKGVELVACTECGGKKPLPTQRTSTVVTSKIINDDDFVIAEYMSPMRNQHPLVGAASFDQKIEGIHMIRARPDNLWHIHYGVRAGGDRFYTHRKDMELSPHVFRELRTEPVHVERKAVEPPQMLEEATVLEVVKEPPTMADIPTVAQTAKFSLQTVPGVSAKFAKLLKADGIKTLEDVLELGVEGLEAYEGIGSVKSRVIMNAIGRMQADKEAAVDNSD